MPKELTKLSKQDLKEMDFDDLPEELENDSNPAFIFQGINTGLLKIIAKGNLDTIELARKEMASRGFGLKGEWIGFQEAKKAWGVK